VPTKRIMTVLIAVGTRLPAHPTSMGRVLLAGLPRTELAGYLQRTEFRRYTERTITDPVELRAEVEQVRRQGYAVVDQELEAGLRSAAAPIRNADGEVVAALNVSAHASRTSVQQLEDELVPALLQTAGHIEHDLLRTRRRGS
jgi:IclR family transcriptional regulator, pca regulon regulatory protein